MTTDLQQGIHFVQQAVEYDTKGLVEQAVQLYEVSLKYFENAYL